MERYAFIDVSNTQGTTKGCLDFSISWEKLYKLLTNKKWSCHKIFFYKGHKGKKEKKQLENKINGLGYELRTKLTHIHPDTAKEISVKCDNCGNEFLHSFVMDGNQKSNCDVELTVDALESLSDGDEALIFTGDGDFTYLIEKLIEKGIYITIVSSFKKDKRGNYRFSTRLKSILKREENKERETNNKKKVRFIDINSWKRIIEK